MLCPNFGIFVSGADSWGRMQRGWGGADPTYDKLLELLLPKPGVRLLFLRLTSNRLLQNMALLEASIEQNKDVIEQNKGRLHADAV
jgi:hypothetical protein